MSQNSRREITLLLLSAAVLGAVDSLLPRPVPFLRLGLANIPAVIAVIRLGFLAALEVNVLRSVCVALLMGTIATPTFVLSISGAVSSVCVMSLISRYFGKYISIPAMSAAGAVVSLWAQLLASMVILHDIPVASLLPALSLWGTVSGTVIGFAALLVRNRMPELEALRIAHG